MLINFTFNDILERRAALFHFVEKLRERKFYITTRRMSSAVSCKLYINNVYAVFVLIKRK